MNTLLIVSIVYLIRKYLFEKNKMAPTPAMNVYYQDGKPKFKDAIVEQIKKPAKVSYIMDHGTSISNTHEYCYISYLQLNFAGDKLLQTALFDNNSMTFSYPKEISPIILEAARAYLRDRRDYLGHLN